MFELKCAVQEYAWGKKGEDSTVAKLKASADSDFTINPDASYAEVRITLVRPQSIGCPAFYCR